MRGKRILFITSAALIMFFVTLHVVYRPWQRTWGASQEEISRHMCGDSIIAHPSWVATRAVTIQAGAEAVWQWIVQVGYRRAGFYSYDWLDNDRIPSAREILPEYQHIKEGEQIPLDKDSHATISVLKPNECLVLVFQPDTNATWTWGLYPSEKGETRLVTRLRVSTNSIRTLLLLDYFELFMMRKHMTGIRERAESNMKPVRRSRT